MKLSKLIRKRDRRRKARARNYKRWVATGRRGHLNAFQKNQAKIERLNALIEKTVKERQLTKVYSREEWGAAEPNGTYSTQWSVHSGVQHHTAMPTLPAKATVEQEKERMRALQSIHLNNGWTDIGYALVVFPSGRIYEGRPARYVGAHTLGHNTGYAGWALDGNYDTSKPTKSAVKGCRRAREILGVADKPLYGHNELNPTACPGKHLIPLLGKEI